RSLRGGPRRPGAPLRYWTGERLRGQSGQAVEDTITYMDTKVQSDVSQFVHTWMDHLRHIIRVDRGEEDSAPSPSESDQDDAARSPPQQTTSAHPPTSP